MLCDGCDPAKCATGDVAQMVERSLSMREALGSMPRFSTFLNMKTVLFDQDAFKAILE